MYLIFWTDPDQAGRITTLSKNAPEYLVESWKFRREHVGNGTHIFVHHTLSDVRPHYVDQRSFDAVVARGLQGIVVREEDVQYPSRIGFTTGCAIDIPT